MVKETARNKKKYACQTCGQVSPKWLGSCPGCGAWNTLVEEPAAPGGRRTGRPLSRHVQDPVPISDISAAQCDSRLQTGMDEMDRVLGGGLVPGGMVLLSGEPGIGKSTLLLQILASLTSDRRTILYVSGEESLNQIRLRAERLGSIPETLWVAAESDFDRIVEIAEEKSPAVMAVDSVQTISCSDISSAPGSVSQVREATARLMQFAKARDIPVILVGHVTKEGTIAGPRVLEHLVDTVLYFEGDRSHTFRLLRTVKNRYGPTHEIGVFEMSGTGLMEVPNPSEIFLSQRPEPVPGSIIVPCMEGTRPILVEIQSLVSPSHLNMPRRTATGIDNNRLALLVAIMERHLAVPLYDRDIFVNVVGGMKITETAADLGIILAMLSSLNDTPLDRGTAVFGEVGLTGEVRPVSRHDMRLNEVRRLGLRRCIIPVHGSERLTALEALDTVPVKTISEASKVC